MSRKVDSIQEENVSPEPYEIKFNYKIRLIILIVLEQFESKVYLRECMNIARIYSLTTSYSDHYFQYPISPSIISIEGFRK